MAMAYKFQAAITVTLCLSIQVQELQAIPV